MNLLSFKEFDRIYQEIVHTIYRHWTPQMQNEMALHCYSWRSGLFDFRNYLKASVVRYYTAYRSFSESSHVQSVCDLGGFWGAFPVTLRRLGFKVALTESLKYYGSSFKPLFELILAQGVEVLDYDPFHPGQVPGKYDVVTLMAVLEHYPHSLRTLMSNVIAMVIPEGKLYIEVPNIAYWPKRMNLLCGKSPLPAIYDIYQSNEPFIGHHHEFTRRELRTLIELSDFRILKEFVFTYSVEGTFLRKFLRRPLETAVQVLRPETRECIAMLCQKRVNES